MNKKEVEAYQRIHAPFDLKEKVMQTSKQRSKKQQFLPIMLVLGITMCICVCFGGFISIQNHSFHVLIRYQNIVIQEAPLEVADGLMTLSHERQVPTLDIELIIETKEMTKISVTQGTLQFYDANLQFLDFKNEVSIDEKTTVIWQISEPSAYMQMIVQTHNDVQRLELKLDENAQKWILQKMK